MAGEGRDLAWGVSLTPLHLALMEGRWLQVRRMLAEDPFPGEETLQLVRLQDHPASHLLMLETGQRPAWLPGSAGAGVVARVVAGERADALALALAAGIPEGGGAERRERL